MEFSIDLFCRIQEDKATDMDCLYILYIYICTYIYIAYIHYLLSIINICTHSVFQVCFAGLGYEDVPFMDGFSDRLPRLQS